MTEEVKETRIKFSSVLVPETNMEEGKKKKGKKKHKRLNSC